MAEMVEDDNGSDDDDDVVVVVALAEVEALAVAADAAA